MTFHVQGSINGEPYIARWFPEGLVADQVILRAVPVDDEEWRVTPTGPFYTWDETDPVVVWAWLRTETTVTDVTGDPPAWQYPVLPAGVVG